MTTVKIDKRGSIGENPLRPTLLPEPENWSRERTAYFMLINTVTKEEWDRMVPDVLAMGLDPKKVKGIPANYRETLPSLEEWDRQMSKPDSPRLRKQPEA